MESTILGVDSARESFGPESSDLVVLRRTNSVSVATRLSGSTAATGESAA